MATTPARAGASAGRKAPFAGENGFALLAALWLIVVIAGVSLSITGRGVSRRLLSQNLSDALIADAALEAGAIRLHSELAEAIERLQDAGIPRDPWEGLLPYADSGGVGGGRYLVVATDLEARLNVNLASADELRRLAVAAGIDDRRARIIAESILDWRDEDDLHRANGAERDWYRASDPLHLGPANSPLSSVTEIRLVRGVTAEIFQRLAPLLTVDSDGRVNWNTAPAPVLVALPGLSTRAVATILNRRAARRPFHDVYELALELPHADRELLEANVPVLMLRSSFEVRRLLVDLEGSGVDGRFRRSRRLVYSREGAAVYAAMVQSGG